MKILGIDEAGRGPVIGPLVIAGVLIDEGKEQHLKNMGVKDSKLLTAAERERLCERIKENYVSHTIIIEPAEIDDAVAKGSITIKEISNKTMVLLEMLVTKLFEVTANHQPI